jgi:hypothetical protein
VDAAHQLLRFATESAALAARDQAAVHTDRHACHIARPFAGEERHDVGIFMRLAVSSQRNGGRAFFCHRLDGPLLALRLRTVEKSNAVRGDAARHNDICGDPSRATSRESVFDQPTSDILNAFDIPKLGMGAITPDDALVITRLQRFLRIPGNTPSVIEITDRTMDWNARCHISGDCPDAGVGGGPPVLFTSMSTDPKCASIAASRAPITAVSARSHVSANARPPASRTAASDLCNAPASISASRTFENGANQQDLRK